MKAAIYARKSTVQDGTSDEQKSIARQIDHARAFATAKGWMVLDDHLYADDGISGAEFANRPGLMRLMNALDTKTRCPAPFQVLIVSDLDRIGREQLETGYILKQLAVAGVRVYSYLESREIALDSPVATFLMQAQAFAGTVEREKGRQRTYDAMVRKAKAGHAVGGRCFGYDNVEVVGPTGKRSHVERRINEAEATVVKRIFEESANGTGLSRIAKRLNADHAVAPRPQQGRVAGWCPSSVREILFRPLYRGEFVWNQSRKRDVWGQHRQSARPETEWLRVPVPHLRIVDDDLWTRAHDRITLISQRMKTAWGAPMARQRDRDSPYLLAGHGRCAVCGGAMTTLWRRDHQLVYGCLTHAKKGEAICTNALVLPLQHVDRAVLTAFGGDVLNERVVSAILDEVMVALQPARLEDAIGVCRGELASLDRTIANLVTAVERGGASVDPLVSKLQQRQAEREQVAQEMSVLEGRLSVVHDRAAIEQQVLARVARWRDLLTTHVADGRQLLREVLDGPLMFTPNGKTYRFEGAADTEKLLGEVAVALPGATSVASPRGAANDSSNPTWVASPRGTEVGSINGPTSVASPAGIEPAFQP